MVSEKPLTLPSQCANESAGTRSIPALLIEYLYQIYCSVFFNKILKQARVGFPRKLLCEFVQLFLFYSSAIW